LKTEKHIKNRLAYLFITGGFTNISWDWAYFTAGGLLIDINRTWTLNVLCFQRQQLPRAIRKQDTIWESKPGDSRCWATWTAESESDDLGRLGQTATKNCPQFDQFNYDRTLQPHWKYGLDWFSKGHLVNYYHLQ
jgi:hypothetical protein